MKSNYLRKIFTIFTLLGLISLFTVSCGGDDDDPTPATSRNVKYEVTGNFTGGLYIVYTGAAGSGQSADTTTLPWSKEVVVNADVTGLGFGIQSTPSQPGQVGQTVTMKIYLNGKVVKQDSFTAGSNGSMSGSLAYTF